MPVIPTWSKPKSQATGSNGVPNRLASLVASYGDSDSSSDDADDEAEGSEEILDKDNMRDEEDEVLIPAVQTNSDKSINDDVQIRNGEKAEEDVEFIGLVSNPESESFKQVRIKEEPKSDESSADSDSDSSVTSFTTSEDEEEKNTGPKKRQAPKVKGELSFYDLPPIEDLHISVPHEQCQPIGAIKSVVEPLVIVEAYPMTPALDIDSVLFLDEGDRALGRIFDVFGQVKQPHYCVRFNSLDHIDSQGIKPGMLVYCAPKTAHTTFVLVAQLKMMKGTDASWKDDIEPPPDQLEFSDDEMERMKKKGGRRGRVNPERVQNSTETPCEGDVIPSAHPPQNRKRYHANQSTYIPAQVSGFGPPGRGRGGFNPAFRGRGRGGYPRGGGGGGGGGGHAWNGTQIPNYAQQQAFHAMQHRFHGPPPPPFYNQAPPPPPSPVPNGGGPPRQYDNPFVSYSNANPSALVRLPPPQWPSWPQSM